jgi:hypothetical protein
MDWSSMNVSEKIDGSIMKLWYYNGKWHLSTNANIDAEKAEIGDVRRDSFAQVFWEAVVSHLSWKDKQTEIDNWLSKLDPAYTYIFELVSPYTRVVIPYKYSEVYFLGARNNLTNQQFGCDTFSAMALHVDIFPRPKLYPMHTLDQIITVAKELPWDNEGFVCYDRHFNRCKIKSPKYVLAHFARNNNVITRKHLIDVILKGEMKEFLIYASDYKEQIKWTKQLMDEFTAFVDTAGVLARSFRKLARKDAANIIKNFPAIVQPIMFVNLEEDLSGSIYVENWDIYKWERNIERFLNLRGDS